MTNRSNHVKKGNDLHVKYTSVKLHSIRDLHYKLADMKKVARKEALVKEPDQEIVRHQTM